MLSSLFLFTHLCTSLEEFLTMSSASRGTKNHEPEQNSRLSTDLFTYVVFQVSWYHHMAGISPTLLSVHLSPAECLAPHEPTASSDRRVVKDFGMARGVASAFENPGETTPSESRNLSCPIVASAS